MKQIVSLALCLVAILGVLPIGVSAQEFVPVTIGTEPAESVEFDSPSYQMSAQEIPQIFADYAGVSKNFKYKQMKSSQFLVDIIKDVEGFVSKPMWDYSQYSIGYGTCCGYSEEDVPKEYWDGISREKGEELLRNHLENSAERDVNRFFKNIGRQPSQQQFDAMVDFTYALGGAWAYGSRVADYLKNPTTELELVRALGAWCRVDGEVWPGLCSRRIREALIYCYGSYSLPFGNEGRDSQLPVIANDELPKFRYVIYDGNGAKLINTRTDDVNYYMEDSVYTSLICPKWDGHVFNGWKLEDCEGYLAEGQTVKNNIFVKAQWDLFKCVEIINEETSVAVPAAKPEEITTSVLELKAKALRTDGTTEEDISMNWKFSSETDLPGGITLEGNKIAVLNTADIIDPIEVKVIACAGEIASQPKAFTISKPDRDNTEQIVISGAGVIFIPSDESVIEEVYTAQAFNKYGEPVNKEIVWSGDELANVKMENGVVKVSKGEPGTYSLTATVEEDCCNAAKQITMKLNTGNGDGHKWDAWKIVEMPTQEKNGLKQRTCLCCGKTEEKVIPKLFEDVKQDSYFAEAIQWAVINEITSGTTQTEFSPDDGCSRKQVVTFLWRGAGCPTPESTVNDFEDVPEDYYYNEAVCWAVENGITSGINDFQFGPDEICSRKQVVTFLWRGAGCPTPESTVNDFEDVPEDYYYNEAVCWAVENNITTGVDESHFAPDDECVRGQIVTFLYRFYQKNNS